MRLEYDPLLFQGTAPFYAKYRLRYSPEFFRYVVERYGLDGKGRLLDLGCATGQLAIPLAPHFEQVVGMDPDGEMLVEAQSAAEVAGVANARWVLASSWQLGPQLGQFRLVAMGESFHWMDRERVLETLYDLIVPGGGVVIVGQSAHGLGPGEGSAPAYQPIIDKTLRRYLGEKRRAGSGYYEHPEERHESVLRRSRFHALESWTHSYERDWSVDEIVGYLYSTSYSAKRLLGDRVEEFERELRDGLLQVESRGVFATRVDVTALAAFR